MACSSVLALVPVFPIFVAFARAVPSVFSILASKHTDGDKQKLF